MAAQDEKVDEGWFPNLFRGQPFMNLNGELITAGANKTKIALLLFIIIVSSYAGYLFTFETKATKVEPLSYNGSTDILPFEAYQKIADKQNVRCGCTTPSFAHSTFLDNFDISQSRDSLCKSAEDALKWCHRAKKELQNMKAKCGAITVSILAGLHGLCHMADSIKARTIKKFEADLMSLPVLLNKKQFKKMIQNFGTMARLEMSLVFEVPLTTISNVIAIDRPQLNWNMEEEDIVTLRNIGVHGQVDALDEGKKKAATYYPAITGSVAGNKDLYAQFRISGLGNMDNISQQSGILLSTVMLDGLTNKITQTFGTNQLVVDAKNSQTANNIDIKVIGNNLSYASKFDVENLFKAMLNSLQTELKQTSGLGSMDLHFTYAVAACNCATNSQCSNTIQIPAMDEFVNHNIFANDPIRKVPWTGNESGYHSGDKVLVLDIQCSLFNSMKEFPVKMLQSGIFWSMANVDMESFKSDHGLNQNTPVSDLMNNSKFQEYLTFFSKLKFADDIDFDDINHAIQSVFTRRFDMSANYEMFYNACGPTHCTYTDTATKEPSEIITLLLALMATLWTVATSISIMTYDAFSGVAERHEEQNLLLSRMVANEEESRKVQVTQVKARQMEA